MKIGGLPGAGNTSAALPAAFCEAMKRDGRRLGMTIKVGRRDFEVTLRAGNVDQIETLEVSVPINHAARNRLLTSPWAMLSFHNYHGITLFPDVMRDEAGDLSSPAPPGGGTAFWPSWRPTAFIMPPGGWGRERRNL